MYTTLSFFSLASLLLSLVNAKQCVNLTIPVDISARNGVFDIPPLQSNIDATAFAQRVTSNAGNYSQESLQGYATIGGNYEISAKFCRPDNENGSSATIQFLTHGIGFDKSYWDLPFNNFNYSYIDVAVDQYGFCTLSVDRLGTGNSSVADPLNVVQFPAEESAIYELTLMLREGTLPNVPKAFQKVVHVGHSVGSILIYRLVADHPTISDGIVLTSFSLNASYFAATMASLDSKLAHLNQPLRFGNVDPANLGLLSKSIDGIISQYLVPLNTTREELLNLIDSTDLLDFIAGIEPQLSPLSQDLPSGYLTWTDAGSNQYTFFYPGFFDPDILTFSELNKFPYTAGELLTIGGIPKSAASFKGPVQVVTGRQDFIFCGGDCLVTGNSSLASIPAAAEIAFPAASTFVPYIQPNTGHGLNLHYNSSGAYNVIQKFLIDHRLGPS